MSNVINFPTRPATRKPLVSDAVLQVICGVLILLFVLAGLIGLAHPAPWSPMGKAQHAAEVKR